LEDTGVTRASARDRHVVMQVGVGGPDVNMAKPQGDDRDVNPSSQTGHGRGVPEHMRGELLGGQGRAALAGGLVDGDARFDCVVAEPPAGAGGKRNRGSSRWPPRSFSQARTNLGQRVGLVVASALMAAVAAVTGTQRCLRRPH
jgi:hypothetical protein